MFKRVPIDFVFAIVSVILSGFRVQVGRALFSRIHVTLFSIPILRMTIFNY